jgi:hypothetical protein
MMQNAAKISYTKFSGDVGVDKNVACLNSLVLQRGHI